MVSSDLQYSLYDPVSYNISCSDSSTAGISNATPGIGSSTLALGNSFDKSSCTQKKRFHQFIIK